MVGNVHRKLHDLSDEELLDKIKAHDAAYQEVCEELFERYSALLLRSFLSNGTGDDVEDLVQEVMFDVIRCAPSFSGRCAKAWIFTIAWYVRCEYWARRYKRWALECPMLFYTDDDGTLRGIEHADSKSIPSRTEPLDTVALLLAAIDSLPDAEKLAIFLTTIKGHPNDEVAVEIGISESQLGRNISRGHQHIRNFLQRVLESQKTQRKLSAQKKLSAQEMNKLLDELIETIPDRGGQRYSREIERVTEWIQELDSWQPKRPRNDATNAAGDDGSSNESE